MKRKAIFTLILAVLVSVIFIQSGSVNSVKAGPKTYTQIISANQAESSLTLSPTLIVEPTSFSDLQQSYMQKVATLVFTPDSDMNVSLQGQTKSLANLFEESLMGEFIPAVRLTDNTVDSFINWMNNVYTITDFIAISSQINVIEKLYSDEICKTVNTVYDITKVAIPQNRYDLFSYIGEANAAGCNILMVNGNDKNIEVASEYISAMSKVCWAYTENKMQAISSIAAGCQGILSNSVESLIQALAVFKNEGFTRAQHISAHRGITSYANENSLTAIAAASNEGATHIELDVQITEDGELMICHDSQTNATSVPGFYFITTDAEKLQSLTLCDYTMKYGDTYPLLEEAIELAKKTDLILMLELKLDAASTTAIDELHAVEKFAEIMQRYPEMNGRWFVITFYAPVAEKMRELLPEIPVGFIGGATSGKETDENKTGWNGGWTAMSNIKSKISFMRKYNTFIDESSVDTPNSLAPQYLARGYTMNTWTFTDISHFNLSANLVTTDVAEQCAMFVKTVGWNKQGITEEELQIKKLNLPCTTYNGWIIEQECDIIVIEKYENSAVVLPYYYQVNDVASYGIYGTPIEVAII